MDKLSKLHALLPETQFSTTTGESSPWTQSQKPKHLYEGTDSEDDEDIMRGDKILQSWTPATKSTETEGYSNDQPLAKLIDCQLELGQLAVEGEAFCPWNSIKKYPYMYIGTANRDKVTKGFWEEGKIFNQTWDFFYIRRLTSDCNQTPIILVPTRQFETFLKIVSQKLKIQLAIPSGGGVSAFEITFDNDDTPRPRYLGKSTDREMADNLHSTVPPHWFKHRTEAATTVAPSDRSLAAFKAKMDLIAQAQKGKKTFTAEKKKGERIAKQRSWNHSVKRVQRYLGLRQASDEQQAEVVRVRDSVANSGLEWNAYSSAVKAATPRSADFSPDTLAPYDQESDVVFVCVDVEANERNSAQITEIGVATLDTRDLKSLLPGESGTNWLGKIRARHFRIDEYKHIRNTEFVSGCPDRFEFGQSEFVSIRHAPQAVANCFKPPFSKPDENTIVEENAPKRNIIFVGHGVGADITYLKSIGYDIYNLSNLQEIVDTALMWQALKRELSPRSLGGILVELDITGWNLHNAGNDAVYTLQAMIGISIKQLYERHTRKEDKEQEKKARVEESVKEAKQNALEREEGWSSGGDNSDGGAPIAPFHPGTKKPLSLPAKKGPQCHKGSWRTPAQSEGMSPQIQKNSESWRSTTASGYSTTISNNLWGQVGQTTPAQQSALLGPTLTLAHRGGNPSEAKTDQAHENASWVQGETLPPASTQTSGAQENALAETQ